MSKAFVWCSAHTPTTEQLEELEAMGSVVFLKDEAPELQERLNSTPSDRGQMEKLVLLVAEQVGEDRTIVQLGGSPLFMYIAGSKLQSHMSKRHILFAHSERVSEDVTQDDGTIKKVSTFKHLGFI